MMPPAFPVLTGAAVVSKLGDQFLKLALPWAVLTATHSPLLGVLSVGVDYAPYALSPLLGALVDRYDRRRLFLITEVARAAVVALLPVLLWTHDARLLMSALLVSGLAGAISSITTDFGLIPSLVPPHQVDRAYARYNAAQEIARLSGPAIAGLVIAAGGLSVAIWIDAATFLATAIAAVHLPKKQRRGEPASLRTMLVGGIAEFRRLRDVRRLTWTLAVYNLGMGGLTGAIVTIAAVHWQWSSGQTGLMLSGYALASALGALIGPKVLAKWPLPKRIAGWLLVCLSGALLLMSPPPWAALCGLGLLGFAEAAMNVLTLALRARVIPSELSGRVNSIIRMFIWGPIPISSVILGTTVNAGTQWLALAPVPVLCGLATALWIAHAAGQGHDRRSTSEPAFSHGF